MSNLKRFCYFKDPLINVDFKNLPETAYYPFWTSTQISEMVFDCFAYYVRLISKKVSNNQFK